MLLKAMHKEMERCRELKKLYDEIPTGVLGASIIETTIKSAEKSIEEDDPVKMLLAFEELKKIEG